MAPAHVSVEVEQDGPQGPTRRRLALSVGLRPLPAELRDPRRLVPGGPRPRRAVGTPLAQVSAGDARFERAVAELERLGHSRERARHIVAIRMRLPQAEIERLREAAR
jgi:hypothetical protein